MKTIDIIKAKRQVSEELKEKLRETRKINKQIFTVLKEKDKTIPEIADETKLESHVVTFYLMTLLKYGKVEVGEIDDMDEYYYYKLKK